MQSKLNFLVRGVNNSDDLKLIENNLNELVGIKAVELAPFKSHLEIKIDFDSNKISQQQIFDVIGIGGDFSIEEQSEAKPRVAAESKIAAESFGRNRASADAARSSRGNFFSSDPANMFFFCGLLGGIVIASIMINIVLAYFLLTPKI